MTMHITKDEIESAEAIDGLSLWVGMLFGSTELWHRLRVYLIWDDDQDCWVNRNKLRWINPSATKVDCDGCCAAKASSGPWLASGPIDYPRVVEPGGEIVVSPGNFRLRIKIEGLG